MTEETKLATQEKAHPYPSFAPIVTIKDATRKPLRIANAQWPKALRETLVAHQYGIENTYSQGDCFFDSVARGLAAADIPAPADQKGSGWDCKSVRLLCSEYLQKIASQDPSHWVIDAMNKNAHGEGQDGIGDDFKTCLKIIQYTSDEMAEKNKVPGEYYKGRATWGRPYIEGRLICEALDIRLHYLELVEKKDEDYSLLRVKGAPDPTTIEGNAIVIEGDGLYRTAYLIQNKVIIKKSKEFSTMELGFEDEERAILSLPFGKIERTDKNSEALNWVIAKLGDDLEWQRVKQPETKSIAKVEFDAVHCVYSKQDEVGGLEAVKWDDKRLIHVAGNHAHFVAVVQKRSDVTVEWGLSGVKTSTLNPLALLLEKTGKKPEFKVDSATPFKTRGGGDCAFHAVMGKWNGMEFACKDIRGQRRGVADRIRNSKSGDNLFSYIKAGIEAMLMGGGGGAHIKNLKKAYGNYLKDNEVSISIAWSNFEKELKKYPEILDYLKENVPDAKESKAPINNKTIFNTCLNKNGGLLYGLILSIPELNAAFVKYNHTTNEGFNLDAFLSREVINEYADYIQTQGNWLLPVELKMLAYALDVTVIYSLRGRTPSSPYKQVDIFNPGKTKQVEVGFNGSNHYERMGSNELLILEQEMMALAIQESKSAEVAPSPKKEPVPDVKLEKKEAKDEKEKTTDLTAITAEELISQIESLNIKFEDLIAQKKDGKHLKEDVKVIRYYFDHPSLVHQATYHGGVARIKEKYSALLLRISLYIKNNTDLDAKQSQQVNNGFGLFAQRVKVKRAYTELYKGEKFKKVQLGDFDKKHPISQQNPVKATSNNNIQQLEEDLAALEGGDNLYNLRDDEIDLFGMLLNLPYRLQHATNYYYPILNTGALDSYTEIKRREPSYCSTFSTKGNVDKLGNGGFVFFRLYVEPVNSSQTRYGDTSLIFDLNLLSTCGWVSLHDQLNPFPSKSPNSRRLYWGKRLLRTSQVVAISNTTKNKALHDGLQYHYRSSVISTYKGSKDTLTSFGKTIETTESQRSFLDEMFYGKDILPGIALSVIRELRHLEACGFRAHFIRAFSAATAEQRANMLGELLKGLFRIEGKYPASLRMQADAKLTTLFFKPIAKTDTMAVDDRRFTVLNPDGDGRYNVDMSINQEAVDLANLRMKQQSIADELTMARRQRARYKDKEKDKDKIEKYTDAITALEARQLIVNEQLNKSARARQQLISYFVANHGSNQDDFEKVDTTKMQFIRNNYAEPLEEKIVAIDTLLVLSFKQLQLIMHESLLDLIVEEVVAFNDLTNCTPEELEVLVEYDVAKPITEQGMTIADLLALYKKNPMHLVCLTCDDLAELVLEQAPDVDPIVMEYAKENDVDFDWVVEQLCETDAVMFSMKLEYEYEQEDEREEEYSYSAPEDDEPDQGGARYRG